jgi:hypothetical protein
LSKEFAIILGQRILLDVIGVPPAMRAELYPGGNGAAIGFTKFTAGIEKFFLQLRI